MLFSKRTALSYLGLLLSIVQLLKASHIPKHKQHHHHPSKRVEEVVCGTQVVITTLYILVPIYIDIYISENTTLPVYEYLTLDIKNAPTSISTIFTGTTTSMFTQSNAVATNPVIGQHITHSAADFSYVDGYTFMITMRDITPGNQNANAKRQAAVLGGTSSCANAVIYSLINGQLFANSTSGALQYGTSVGVQYANFTPSASPGALVTLFSVDSQYNLIWSNANFDNNQAKFCVMPDGMIVAVFAAQSTAPATCVFVSLSLTRVSSCVGQVGGAILSGPQGPVGATGPQGVQGIPGATGPQGLTGMAGVAGATGAVGPQGVSGLSGLVGATGPQGLQGVTGAVGAQGVQGVTGAVGPTGLPGVSGLPGLSGAVGATGQIGPTGVQGVQGVPGISGLPGIQGPSGQNGPTGVQGVQGVQGVPGISGLPGVQGPSGPSGLPGVSGLPGIQGIQGPIGAVGAVGPSGPSGPIGPSGISGLVGAIGPSGPTGITGATGIAFAYLGCYKQSNNAASTVSLGTYALDGSLSASGFGGGYQSTLTGTLTNSLPAQCAAICLPLSGANFFGLVNSAGSTGECYCGKSVNPGSTGLGLLTLNLCTTCNGAVIGQCGQFSQTSISLYGRSF